jgi:hypothetical protein
MKSLTVAVLICTFAFTLSAQDKKAPGEHSMTGCLRNVATPNSYMLRRLREVTRVCFPKLTQVVYS